MLHRPFRWIPVACALLLLAAACSPPDGHGGDGSSSAPAEPAVDYEAALSAPGRTERDLERDADRKPAGVLEFFGIRPGMQVADLMATGGYYTVLLSEVVGPEGKVWAHNNEYFLGRSETHPLADRLAGPGMQNVEVVDAGMNDPQLPSGLDAALLVRFYHDFGWMEMDRAEFNRHVFEALKPGGIYGILDHHAETGSGDRDVQTLHRVDIDLVKREVEAAGFVLEAESDLLHDPSDTRDWNIFQDRGARRDKTDRFLLRFRKPANG